MDYLDKWRQAPTTLKARLEKEVGAIRDAGLKQSETRLLDVSFGERNCYAVPGDSLATKSYKELGLPNAPKGVDCLVCQKELDSPYQFVECKYGISLTDARLKFQKVSELYDDLSGKDSSMRRILEYFKLPANEMMFAVFNSEVAPIARSELADYSAAIEDGFHLRVFATDTLIPALESTGVVFACAK